MKIIPGPLTSDLKELEKYLKEAEKVVDRIQIDVVDGIFAENKTIDPIALTNVETKLAFDFHLMVKDPINWIQKCVGRAEDRIIGQIEEMGDQRKFIDEVLSNDNLVGLGVDLDTPITMLDESVLEDLNVIILMSVKAGFAGQEFNLPVMDKIKELDDIRKNKNLHFVICVDGGVTHELVHDMEKLGVDEVIVGKRIFEGDGLKKNIDSFTKL